MNIPSLKKRVFGSLLVDAALTERPRMYLEVSDESRLEPVRQQATESKRNEVFQ